MNTFAKLIFTVSMSLVVANAHATISCSKPKLSKVVERNSVYHFKSVVTCKLENEKVDLKTLKDIYKAEILSKGSQFTVHKQENYDNKKGMTGYSLDVTQSYDTSNGYIKVRAKVLLEDDNANNFYMELRSKSIDGQGDSQYEKSILNTVSLKMQQDNGDLIVTKEIDVEQPWYAPESVFRDKVETELYSSIKKAAQMQARKITGEKVDALRK